MLQQCGVTYYYSGIVLQHNKIKGAIIRINIHVIMSGRLSHGMYEERQSSKNNDTHEYSRSNYFRNCSIDMPLEYYWRERINECDTVYVFSRSTEKNHVYRVSLREH